MAHSVIHFSIGVIAGTAATIAPVINAWRNNLPMADKIRRWLLISYAAGIYAIIPSLLHWLGLPDKFCGGWWMNIFLFHPLINKIETSSHLIPASIAVFLCFILPYFIIVAAIYKSKHKPKEH